MTTDLLLVLDPATGALVTAAWLGRRLPILRRRGERA